MTTGNARKLFGTDGVRGVANVEPVTAETALKLGRAAAHVFRSCAPIAKGHGRHKIVVGKDTRLSGYMLENAISAGILSMGVDVLLIGPLPTPGVAYITRSLRADAGIVLTASHNPYEDNGIKFFRDDGYKLDDAIEKQIEGLVFSGEIEKIRPTADAVGKAMRIDDALGRYVEFAKAAFPKGMTLEGLRVVVDAGHGATYKSTPCVLRELGASVTVLNNTPDGTNINKGCGSTHPEVICGYVKQLGADVGLSHDGDGDRVQLCDETGTLVDGDDVLAITALDWLTRGELKKGTLVATVMSNLGLDHTVRKAGGQVVRTQVGDRYVIEKMLQEDLNVGGEQSGHMIFRDFTTTGDGVVSALQVLRIMMDTGKPLSELRQVCTKFPQVVVNVRVKEKPAWDSLPDVMQLVKEVEAKLSDQGRVLLRYSGTEPKARLLIEGPDGDQIKAFADEIAGRLKEKIGA
ncbi:MAG TPA: phosphoglucosamine mutase [Verrucomicrobiae bacterium]|nr:phosphoglucosamine mutase [Verrucomicrobiae bacterium]